MKFYLSLLMFFGIPLFVLAQAASPAGAPAGNAAAPATLVPTVVVPTPTATVDLAHAPKITCAIPKFDFHNVDEGPDIVHEFRIRNKGKGSLKITNVGTSCGCTAAVVKKQGAKDEAASLPVEIPAGGRGTIKATYHTSGRPGHATKIITVSSNDPVNPNFQMQLDMTVVRDVDVQPDRVYLYGVHYKQAHSTTIKILGKPDMPLSILSAVSSNKVVTVTSLTPFSDEKEKRSGATLQVDLPVTQPIGSFTDEIVVKTDNEKKPEVKIQVMGEVTGRVQYSPKSLSFAPHQDAPVTLQFTVDPAKGFTIRNVQSVKHLVRPRIRKTSGSGGIDQFSLIVSVVKNLPKDSDGKDQIIVETNDADQAKFTIEVQAAK